MLELCVSGGGSNTPSYSIHNTNAVEVSGETFSGGGVTFHPFLG